MAKIIAFTNLTLDGVMQAPGRSDEDTRNGFKHGGWATSFGAMQEVGDALANPGAVLFGRWTYESFYDFWPNQSNNPFTAFFNNIPKYVASTTLDEPLAWVNSTLLKNDLAKDIGKLKTEQDKKIVIFGSGVLIQSLVRNNLVDKYVLLIHPLVLGTGHRLFADDGTFAALRLIDSKTTAKGVVIATYEPAGSSSEPA